MEYGVGGLYAFRKHLESASSKILPNYRLKIYESKKTRQPDLWASQGLATATQPRTHTPPAHISSKQLARPNFI